MKINGLSDSGRGRRRCTRRRTESLDGTDAAVGRACTSRDANSQSYWWSIDWPADWSSARSRTCCAELCCDGHRWRRRRHSPPHCSAECQHCIVPAAAATIVCLECTHQGDSHFWMICTRWAGRCRSRPADRWWARAHTRWRDGPFWSICWSVHAVSAAVVYMFVFWNARKVS